MSVRGPTRALGAELTPLDHRGAPMSPLLPERR
jgi:hypothetical protein